MEIHVSRRHEHSYVRKAENCSATSSGSKERRYATNSLNSCHWITKCADTQGTETQSPDLCSPSQSSSVRLSSPPRHLLNSVFDTNRGSSISGRLPSLNPIVWLDLHCLLPEWSPQTSQQVVTVLRSH